MRLRLATTLDKAVRASAFSSYRELARAAGIDQAHLHLISAGKKDTWLSTLVALVETLGLSMAELGRLFDEITAKEITAKEIVAYVQVLEERRKQKGNSYL